jgi:hypothetical protein
MIYQFTLIDYTTDTNGVSTIIEEPNGWDGMELSLKRDDDTHGVFFDCSIDSLEFYGAGASIIKTAYDTYKVESKVDILIEVKCGENDAFETLYDGRLVFTSYKYFQKDDCYVSIGIEQKGALIEFRNKYENKVNLDTSTKTKLPFNTQLPSKGILKTTEFYNDNVQSESECTEDLKIGGGLGGYVDREFKRYWGIDLDTQTKDEIDTYSSRGLTANYSNDTALFIVEESGVYNVDVSLVGRAFGWASVGCRCSRYANVETLFSTSDNHEYGYDDLWCDVYLEVGSNVIALDTGLNLNVDTEIPYLLDCGEAPVGGYYTPSFSTTNNPYLSFNGSHSGSYTLNKGDEIKLYAIVKQTGHYERRVAKQKADFQQGLQILTGSFNVNFISYYPATPCDIYAINETFAEITEQITDSKISVYSDYFGRTDAQPYTSSEDGCGSLMAITKGEKIRGIEIQNNEPKLELSFKDVFDSINAIHNIGIAFEDAPNGSYENIIRIEPVEYFYDSATTLLTCDNVAEIEYNTDLKRMYQNITIGYDKYEAEEATGIDEFLTKHEYSIKSTQISNKKEIVSKFIAGGYTWEITRRVGNDTTSDWRYDKETFVVCLKRDSGNLVVEQGNIVTDTNIVDPPTIYNYAITPTRNLMRWFKSISASLVDYTTDYLYYTTGLSNVFASGKNNNSCTIEASTIAENQNISYSNFSDSTDATPLWKPITATFKYPLSYTDFKTIKSNPNGVIKFSHDDTNWSYGYILELGYVPTDGMATFKLLLINS